MLIGMWAWGRNRGNIFEVQVDALNHPWATGWHKTGRRAWFHEPLGVNSSRILATGTEAAKL